MIRYNTQWTVIPFFKVGVEAPNLVSIFKALGVVLSD
jgi:hypothetical protein